MTPLASFAEHLLLHSAGLLVLGCFAFALARLWRRDPISSYRFHRCLLYAVLALPLLQVGLAGRVGAETWAPMRAWWAEAAPAPASEPFLESTASPTRTRTAAEPAPSLALEPRGRWVAAVPNEERSRPDIVRRVMAAPARVALEPHNVAATSVLTSTDGAPSQDLLWGWILAVGGALVAGWHVLRLVATQRMLARCEPTTDPNVLDAWQHVARDSRLRDRVRLLTGEHLQSPGCFGILRPVLIVPASAGRPEDRNALECALMHELVHLERGDARVAFLAAIARALFWFHPVVWWITKELERLRESSCDLAVVRRTGRPKSYALALLSYAFDAEGAHAEPQRLTGWSASRAACPTLLHWTHSPSQLRRRIEMLANQRPAPSRAKRVLTFGLAAVALSSLWGGQLATAAAIFPKDEEPTKAELEARIAALQERTDELLEEIDVLLATMDEVTSTTAIADGELGIDFIGGQHIVLGHGDDSEDEPRVLSFSFQAEGSDEPQVWRVDGEKLIQGDEVFDLADLGSGRFLLRSDGSEGAGELEIVTDGAVEVDEAGRFSIAIQSDGDDEPQVFVLGNDEEGDHRIIVNGQEIELPHVRGGDHGIVTYGLTCEDGDEGRIVIANGHLVEGKLPHGVHVILDGDCVVDGGSIQADGEGGFSFEFDEDFEFNGGHFEFEFDSDDFEFDADEFEFEFDASDFEFDGENFVFEFDGDEFEFDADQDGDAIYEWIVEDEDGNERKGYSLFEFRSGDDDESDGEAIYEWIVEDEDGHEHKGYGLFEFRSDDDDDDDEDEDDDQEGSHVLHLGGSQGFWVDGTQGAWTTTAPEGAQFLKLEGVNGQGGTWAFSTGDKKNVFGGQGGHWTTAPDSDEADGTGGAWVYDASGEGKLHGGVAGMGDNSWFGQQSSGRRLGVSVESPGAALAGHLGIAGENALVITTVEDKSHADKAGLKVHDVIVGISGQESASYDALRAAIEKATKKDPLKLNVLRKGNKKKVVIKFEEKKPKASKKERARFFQRSEGQAKPKEKAKEKERTRPFVYRTPRANSAPRTRGRIQDRLVLPRREGSRMRIQNNDDRDVREMLEKALESVDDKNVRKNIERALERLQRSERPSRTPSHGFLYERTTAPHGAAPAAPAAPRGTITYRTPEPTLAPFPGRVAAPETYVVPPSRPHAVTAPRYPIELVEPQVAPEPIEAKLPELTPTLDLSVEPLEVPEGVLIQCPEEEPESAPAPESTPAPESAPEPSEPLIDVTELAERLTSAESR